MKTTVWLVIFVIGSCTLTHAQYYEQTHRQSADQIKLFRSHHFKLQVLYLQQADNSEPYGINYYDTSGRVTLIANPTHHEHFAYDDKGRMVYWLDSANDGRRFQKFEYHFGYDAQGIVNQYKSPTTESRFTSTGANTTEDVMRNGIIIQKNIYTYNSDGKLTEEISHEVTKDSVGKLTYLHKIFYNKYGDLASEIIFNAMKDCVGDSTIIINTYDNKGMVIHRQKSVKTLSCGATPTAILRKTVAESISFMYNAAGQLTTESMISNNPSLNYKKEYVYDENGIILKELGFDGKGRSTTNMLYSYVHFPLNR